MIRHLLAFSVLCLSLIAAPARAQDSDPATDIIGMIVASEGTVTVAGQPAGPDSPLRRKDVIETGSDSRALILLKDDSQFTLGADAQFSAEDYVFDESRPDANRARYHVMRGAFLYASGLIDKNKNPDVQIETGYVSIGIRGTILWCGAIDGGYGVLVQEGKVLAQTQHGSRMVYPSRGTMIKGPNPAPSRPVSWPEEKVARAFAAIAFSDQAAADARLKERKDHQQAARQKTIIQEEQQTTP